MSKIVAVIAAHPDDEVLGCGGAIASHTSKGDKVHLLIMAEGATSRDVSRSRAAHQDELSDLARAAELAKRILGATTVSLLDFPDNRMDSIDLLEVVKAVEIFVNKYQPEIIYTHHASDVNIDHQIVHKAVITATRPIPSCPVKVILTFEVMSSTEWQPPSSMRSFQPNWYVKLDQAVLNKKLEALKAYESEMRRWPHSRSYQAIEYLAKWRGATIGHEAAEAFELCRRIYE